MRFVEENMNLKSNIKKLAMCTALALSFTAGAVTTNVAVAKDIRGWNIHVVDYPVSIALDSFSRLHRVALVVRPWRALLLR